MIYTDKVMDHFQNPRNVGVIKDADGTGKVGNPVCGDMMTFTIKSRTTSSKTSNSRHSAAGPPSPSRASSARWPWGKPWTTP